MNFSVLSRYDDMLASYFVDSLYLWFKTLRMNSDFVGTTVQEQEIIKVIREEIISCQQVPMGIRAATTIFLEFPYFKEFVRDLPKRQALEFTQHMKRYLYMYAHNAGFEVGSTKRYTGKLEACIVATKDWKAGEQVKCCLGSIAELSEADDAKLKKEGRDFSVMVSTRKKCTCLFLGPARFMNHDCDSNCEFLLIGHNAVTFKVRRDIACGEEMTVYYADHYFGENNCECRCTSCERLQQGSFSVQSTEDDENPDTPESAEADGETTNIRRSQRKRKEISYKDYIVHHSTKRVRQSPNESRATSPLNETTNASPTSNQTLKDIQTIGQNSKHINMDLSFICNEEQNTESWTYIPAEDDSRKYVISGYDSDLVSTEQQFHLHLNSPTPGEYISLPYPPLLPHAYRSIQNQSMEEKTLDFSNKPTVEDEDMSNFCNWLDIQSDLSDENDNGTVIMEVAETDCCAYSKDFVKFKTTEGQQLCARCYRHYKIYGIQWPLRKPSRKAKDVRLLKENSNSKNITGSSKPSNRVTIKKTNSVNGMQPATNSSEPLSMDYHSPCSSSIPFYSTHSTYRSSSTSKLPLVTPNPGTSQFSNSQLPTTKSRSIHPVHSARVGRASYDLRPKHFNIRSSSTYQIYDVGIARNQVEANSNRISINTMHPVTKSSMLTMKDSQINTNRKESRSVYPISITVTKEDLQSIPAITSQYIPDIQYGKEWLLAHQKELEEPLYNLDVQLDKELKHFRGKLRHLMNKKQGLQKLKRKYQLLHIYQSSNEALEEYQTQNQDSETNLSSNANVHPQIEVNSALSVSSPGSLVDSSSDSQLGSQPELSSDFEFESQTGSPLEQKDLAMDTILSPSNIGTSSQFELKTSEELSSAILEDSVPDSQPDAHLEQSSDIESKHLPDPSDLTMDITISSSNVDPQLTSKVSTKATSSERSEDFLSHSLLDSQPELPSDFELASQVQSPPKQSDIAIDTVFSSCDADKLSQFKSRESDKTPSPVFLSASHLKPQQERSSECELQTQAEYLLGRNDPSMEIESVGTRAHSPLEPESSPTALSSKLLVEFLPESLAGSSLDPNDLNVETVINGTDDVQSRLELQVSDVASSPGYVMHSLFDSQSNYQTELSSDCEPESLPEQIKDISNLCSYTDVQSQLEPKASRKLSFSESLVDCLSNLQLKSQVELLSDHEFVFGAESQEESPAEFQTVSLSEYQAVPQAEIQVVSQAISLPDSIEHIKDTQTSDTEAQPELQLDTSCKVSSQEPPMDSLSDSQLNFQAELPSKFEAQSLLNQAMDNSNVCNDTCVQSLLELDTSLDVSSHESPVLSLSHSLLSNMDLEFQPDEHLNTNDEVIDTSGVCDNKDVEPQLKLGTSLQAPSRELYVLPLSDILPSNMDLESQSNDYPNTNGQTMDTSDACKDTDTLPQRRSTDVDVDNQLHYEIYAQTESPSSDVSDSQLHPRQACQSIRIKDDSHPRLDKNQIDRLNSIMKAREPTVIIKQGGSSKTTSRSLMEAHEPTIIIKRKAPSSSKPKLRTTRISEATTPAWNHRSPKTITPLSASRNQKKASLSISRDSSKATAPFMVIRGSEIANFLERPREPMIVVRTVRIRKAVKKECSHTEK